MPKRKSAKRKTKPKIKTKKGLKVKMPKVHNLGRIEAITDEICRQVADAEHLGEKYYRQLTQASALHHNRRRAANPDRPFFWGVGIFVACVVVAGGVVAWR